jgi:hypothetical protein
MWLIYGRVEMHTGWWENVKDKRPLGEPRHRWEHNIKCTLKLALILYIYLTAVGLTPGGSSTVHIYTQHTEYRERNICNNK